MSNPEIARYYLKLRPVVQDKMTNVTADNIIESLDKYYKGDYVWEITHETFIRDYTYVSTTVMVYTPGKIFTGKYTGESKHYEKNYLNALVNACSPIIDNNNGGDKKTTSLSPSNIDLSNSQATVSAPIIYSTILEPEEKVESVKANIEPQSTSSSTQEEEEEDPIAILERRLEQRRQEILREQMTKEAEHNATTPSPVSNNTTDEEKFASTFLQEDKIPSMPVKDNTKDNTDKEKPSGLMSYEEYVQTLDIPPAPWDTIEENSDNNTMAQQPEDPMARIPEKYRNKEPEYYEPSEKAHGYSHYQYDRLMDFKKEWNLKSEKQLESYFKRWNPELTDLRFNAVLNPNNIDDFLDWTDSLKK